MNNPEEPPQSNGWITKKELTARLGIKTRALERWMKAGYLPFVKIDRLVRFKMEDVDTALKEKFGQNFTKP